MYSSVIPASLLVIPAKAGISGGRAKKGDSSFRWNDDPARSEGDSSLRWNDGSSLPTVFIRAEIP
jgi:hypothetical protein